jgi:hypothetical protein
MPYKVWADTDVLNAADLNAMTADAQTADVATNESSTSASYGDLTTVGPSVTIAVVNGQQILVQVQCRCSGSAGSVGAVMSFAITGVFAVAALDVNGLEVDGTPGGNSSRSTWLPCTATGSITITAKYKCVNPGSAAFLNRRISVKKF